MSKDTFRADEPAAPLRIGVVSDIHFTLASPPPEDAWHGPLEFAGVLDRLRTGLAWFAEEQVDVVAVLGDLSHDGDVASLAAVLELLASEWDGRTLVLAGNHDIREREDALEVALERIRLGRVELAPPAGALLGGVRIAGVVPATGSWEEGPLVLLSHYPVISRDRAFEAQGLRYAGTLPAPGPIVAEIEARRDPTLILNGHLHARDTYQQGNVLQMTVGSLIEAPFELTILDIAVEPSAMLVERRATNLAAGPAIAPLHEARAIPPEPRRSSV
jgi:predicted phosphodiesterase